MIGRLFRAVKLARGVKSLSHQQKASIRATAYQRLLAIAAVKNGLDWNWTQSTGSVWVYGAGTSHRAYKTKFPNREDFTELLDDQGGGIPDEHIFNDQAAPERYELDGVRFWWPITCNVKYRLNEDVLVDLGAVSA